MALISANWAWIRSKRVWMAWPKYFTINDTSGVKVTMSSVRRVSIHNIMPTAAIARTPVDTAYMAAGPAIMRTAPRSADARDIRSPGARLVEVLAREALQLREEIAAQVVLDATRRADDEPAHEIPEDAAAGRDGEQRQRIPAELARGSRQRSGHRRRTSAPRGSTGRTGWQTIAQDSPRSMGRRDRPRYGSNRRRAASTRQL